MTECEMIMKILKRLIGDCSEFNDGKSVEYVNQYNDSIIFDFDNDGNVTAILN